MAAQESPQAGGGYFHPASLILIWLGFALSIPWLRTPDLAGIAGILIILLLFGRSPEFLKLLRRTRWLLIPLILVYAFATPGESLIPALGSYSPSREGLVSGGLQALRLATLLSGLAFLLASVSRDRMLVGLYFLLHPLARLGVNIDRVAARVWLTLHYAEQKEAGRPGEWRENLRAASEGGNGESRTITLEVRRFSWADYLALAFSALLLGLLVARGVA